MPLSLGLDIGTNSVGWALVETNDSGNDGKVIAFGARVFPEGVDRDQQGAEHSKNEQRRIARGMRRQIARRARRKAVLRKSLIACGLLPADREAQQRFDDLDPYQLRAEGLTRRLELYEFGRVLVHLNQRRGFLSNRKADRGKVKENEGLLKEINELQQELGERTLGQFLAEKRSDNEHDRIRNKHTRRDMYQTEFQKLWDKQREFYPAVLTDELRYGRKGPEQKYPRDPEPLRQRKSNSLLAEFGIYGILFFQRSLYWPKSVIGRCELEPREKRCPRADRVAQRFRLLNEVNNLRIIHEYSDARLLTEEERGKALAALSKFKEQTFDQLRKALGLLDSDQFNLERADRKKLLGLPIDHALSHKGLFGKTWASYPEPTKNIIVRSLLEDEAEVVQRKAVDDWGCNAELAERLSEFDPTAIADGYAAYSLKAMENLLPHLEQGLRIMANDETDSALHAAGYLRPDERAVRQSDRLPDVPEEIANPIVRQAMYEVRKLVHAVLREYGKPDHIHIELAREAKGNAIQRANYIRDMRERERKRDAAAEQIREWGHKPTREAIDRLLLWREQGEECLYSGKPISPGQLLGGEVDIDHILPYSRSLDNSLMNKAVAFRSENTLKGQRTPYEWLAEINPAKYAQIQQRSRRLPFAKRQRCSQKEVVLDEFLARQLSDTAYITTCVRQYLLRLGIDIVCTKGQATAELRRLWGLNTVLRDDGLNLKNRDDHRHHAIDALIIALMDRSRLQKLARTRGDQAEHLPPPWRNFRDHVEERAAGIRVSHRVSRKIAGALHEETIYGPTSKPQFRTDHPRPHAEGWVEDAGTFVVRKPLDALTPAMIEEIRDPHVKALVIARLQEYGIDHTAKGAKISKNVWEKELRLKPKSGKDTGKSHVIRYVRVLRRDLTIQPIRGGTACVKPGSTHHICLFDLPGSTPEKPKRDMVAVTMLEVVHRQKRTEPLIQRVHPTIPDAQFLFSLSAGELIWGRFQGGEENLFVYRTAASTTKQMRFVSHCDARLSAESKEYSAKPNTMDAVKVTVDLLGRIRNAND